MFLMSIGVLLMGCHDLLIGFECQCVHKARSNAGWRVANILNKPTISRSNSREPPTVLIFSDGFLIYRKE